MRVAAAQLRCPWLDPTAGTSKVVEYLEKAAADDVGLVAFPETFLSGYPFWLKHTDGARFGDPEQKRAYAAYLDAAVELTGPHLARITEAVRDLAVFTYLGITERVHGTVYCTLLAISPTSGIVSAHRKLMPTYEERLVWGTGDGHGLRVHQVDDIRVGGLNCWENWMPLARHSLYAQGEDLHVSVWPGSTRNTTDITRFIAQEGRVYSLAAGALFSYEDIPADFPFRDRLADRISHCDGGSAIAGPDGEWIVAPVSGKEMLVTADIDPAVVRAERQNFDPVGHYARGDVFDVRVDRTRLAPARFSD
ncbi:carbon-nitrogen hydrolase family protein [Streptomyces sp. NBC_00237]|uniref:carbon-nitrogen hydrolase family protein n=1 Tax=Streptomyces sp. NBC_00237 TaxID=2975687 RepID=UPI00225B59D4|nr:carbon-nitrogen hydrolase family protein [Streptomyces sp. NBC_00237]MCX5205268.1 carbon-nitrogen hydrolase family protein [Streptomyces sp. NBC_00237]